MLSGSGRGGSGLGTCGSITGIQGSRGSCVCWVQCRWHAGTLCLHYPSFYGFIYMSIYQLHVSTLNGPISVGHINRFSRKLMLVTILFCTPFVFEVII